MQHEAKPWDAGEGLGARGCVPRASCLVPQSPARLPEQGTHRLLRDKPLWAGAGEAANRVNASLLWERV